MDRRITATLASLSELQNLRDLDLSNDVPSARLLRAAEGAEY